MCGVEDGAIVSPLITSPPKNWGSPGCAQRDTDMLDNFDILWYEIWDAVCWTRSASWPRWCASHAGPPFCCPKKTAEPPAGFTTGSLGAK